MSKWRVTWSEIGARKSTGTKEVEGDSLPQVEDFAIHVCKLMSGMTLIDLVHIENLIYKVKAGNKEIGHIKITSI